MSRKSFHLLYLVRHDNGFCTGRLLRRWLSASPRRVAAWGFGVEEVKAKLEVELEALAGDEAEIEALRWSKLPALHALRVDVHLLTRLGRSRMVGERTAPLRLSYGLAAAEAGFLLLVPRFDWLLEVEQPELAAALVRQQLAAFLAGSEGDQLLAALPLGEESLEAWTPGIGGPGPAEPEEELQAAFPETLKVAENWSRRGRRGEAALLDVFGVEQHRPLWDREKPASILLVGPHGVGKTSWVRLLAKLLAAAGEEGEEGGGQRVLWASSAAQLTAGMAYLGEWEARCLELARELEYSGHYLYLGSLLPLAEKRGYTSVLELFAQVALEEGRFGLIAECTEDELERAKRLAPSALRLFRQIRLEAPPLREMPALLARYLERRGGPRLSSGGVDTLVHLLEAFERQTAFPGKAFRFADRWRDDLLESGEPAAAPIGRREVVDRFCQVTGLAPNLVAPREAVPVEVVERRLAQVVVGQPEACAAAARVLTRFRAGLYDPEKPLGTLLFVGPSGVGKTELAKQLARILFGDENRLLRFDMSEYHTGGAARRLVALGRGVRSLAQGVRQQPLSVVLLDEIEKAHDEVFDLLLAALGEGRLADENGGQVDLRMCIIVLTSNLGVRRGQSLGFGEAEPTAADYRKAINKFFRPELVNRFDEIVPFRNLDLAAIEKIVELQVAKVKKRPGFRRRGIRLHLEPGARAWLARKGFDRRYGTRPLLRLLESKVVAPLAAFLAENPKTKKLEVYITENAVPAPSPEDLILPLET